MFSRRERDFKRFVPWVWKIRCEFSITMEQEMVENERNSLNYADVMLFYYIK